MPTILSVLVAEDLGVKCRTLSATPITYNHNNNVDCIKIWSRVSICCKELCVLSAMAVVDYRTEGKYPVNVTASRTQ